MPVHQLRRRLIPCAIALVALVISCVELIAETTNSNQPTDPMARAVDALPRAVGNDQYLANRPPLAPAPLIKLPIGAVKPEGWLRTTLELQRDGMTGHLNEISAWLQKDDNAWLSEDGRGNWGWEEMPYWLKGYMQLGYLLDDQEIMDESMVWINAVLDHQREDGNFGPVRTFDDDGSQDFWANMIMLFCLQTYYEHSGDRRVLDFMTRYFRYQLSVPDDKFLTHYWQRMRGGDNLYSVHWLYNLTGEPFLLDLAEKIHRNTANWEMAGDLPNWHNVNIAQGFREPAQWSQQSHRQRDLDAAYDNFKIVRETYGQVPGGMFGSDEVCRPGFTDPRQAIETCGLVEQMLSDEILLAITGDPFWADHTEEVAFNMLPAAFMPDYRSLRYLTSPNMPASDRENHAPGINNGGPFFVMNALSHRCCQHNHSHGWPYFVQHLWMATSDNGVCATMYGPSAVEAMVGDGCRVRIEEKTDYPFAETVTFQISTDAPIEFPLYLRVPGWCDDAAIKVNGERAEVETRASQYIRIERPWRDGDAVTLRLPMTLSVRRWTQNHDAASVNFGPLTFSLNMDERLVEDDAASTALPGSRWRNDLNVNNWPAFEILPDSPWNYGLVLDADQPTDSFAIKRVAVDPNALPFTPESVPIRLTVQARRIPKWQLDQFGLCAPLQDSPVRSTEPIETIELLPMGAARIRMSVFPVIGDGPDAVTWHPPVHPTRLFEVRASHTWVSDSTAAVADSLEPENSHDQTIPRHTFWPHKGTNEWIEAMFDEPRRVNGVSVYWFDDERTGGECRTPQSWQLFYDRDGKWTPVETTDAFGVARDQFNTVEFKPVTTRKLRIEVRLQDGYSAGVLEWKVR